MWQNAWIKSTHRAVRAGGGAKSPAGPPGGRGIIAPAVASLPVAILVVTWALYVGRYWLYWDRFVGGTHDEALWLALALRWTDSSLFARDPFVTAVMPTFPTAYAALMGGLLRLWPDPGTVLLVTSSALLLVYGAGMYRLVNQVVGHRLTAVLIAVVAFRVSFDLAGTGWGIFVGNAPPRSFVFAAVPWILAWFFRAAESPRRLLAVGLALGLLGNVHPLSVLHVVLMLLGALLLDPAGGSRPLRGAALSAGLTAGILPYLVQWVRVRDVTPLPMDIVRFRAEPQSFPSWEAVGAGLLTSYLPLALLALAGWWVSRGDADRGAARWIVRLTVAVAVGAAVGPLLTLASPRLFAIHLLRMSGYGFLLLLVLAAYLLRHALSRRSAAGTLAGAGLAAFLLLTAGATRIADLGPWLRPIHRASAAAGVLPASTGIPGEGDREAFLDLCRWAASQTPDDALFLSPPGAWASFRLYARRGLYVTFKDGAVTVFSGARAIEWFDRESQGRRLYEPAHQHELPAFAAAHGIDYVIQGLRDRPLDLPLAYENGAFRVHRARA